jgi:hypothetical protein
VNYFYYCPAVKNPTGGVKVIYQHAQVLSEMGISAWILHPRSNFKCTWFEHNASIWNSPSITTNDHLIVPEVDTLDLAEMLLEQPIQYTIFVQNGYGIGRGNNPKSLKMVHEVYEKSKFILSISDDTSEMVRTYFPTSAHKIIRVMPSISRKLFSMGSWQEKENIITYMPRKNSDHAEMVMFGLKAWLPSNWRIQAISGVGENEVAELLRKSKIFLSFSSFEGCPLPPHEAALSGNYVIGYHGNGGKEYWHSPVFQEIYPYDIKSFIKAVQSRVTALEHSGNEYCGESSGFHSTIQNLTDTYSTETLKKQLSEFVERTKSLSTPPDSIPKNIIMQYSPLMARLIKNFRKFNRYK